MPIYVYCCSSCGCEAEVFQHSMTDVECCGMPMERKIFVPMVKIKGAGGYPSRVKQIRNTTKQTHPPLKHDPKRVYI